MSGAPEHTTYRHLHAADDRLKADARSRLGWSTLAAVSLHFLAFFGTPTWTSPLRNFTAELSDQVIEWVTVSYFPAWEEGAGSAAGDGAEGAAEELEVSAAAAEEAPGGGDGEAAGSGADPVAVSDALREVLLARALVPTLAEPGLVQPGSPAEQQGGGEGVRVEAGGSAPVAIEGLADADSLALEMLSSLRPELVVLNPSNWILIRNPGAIESFMRQHAASIPALSDGRRTTSVALWIDESGSVEWAEVSQSSGRTELDELALELLSEVATFRPARHQGVRVPTTAIFTIHFPW
jgi:TonB family protein